jgi:hypothetical protein
MSYTILNIAKWHKQRKQYEKQIKYHSNVAVTIM